MRRLPLFVTLLLLLFPNTALAHGYLLRAIPEDRSVLSRAPARIQYWFSEGLEPEFSTLTVRDQNGQIVAEGGLSPNDDKLLTARLPNNLPDGAYTVDLRLAFASDGHVIAERRVFFVGAAVEGISSASASELAVPLEVVWRALALSSTLVLGGVLLIYSAVLLPAWGNQRYRAGLLPPRVMHRLTQIALTALAAALIAHVLALVQQTMVFFGVDFWQALTDGSWNVVRTGTRFGDTWNARLVLFIVVAGLLAASLYMRNRQPQWVRAFWGASLWAMPLIMFTFSINAHAAGSIVLPWVAVFSDWLHGTAVGVWVGGLVALVLVLPTALQPLDAETERIALKAALGRFSLWAYAAAAVVIATGIYNATNWFTEANDFGTPYALQLALKVLMTAGLLALGALHHISLQPERYARLRRFARSFDRLRGTLRLESVVGIGVIVLAGWVSATPVPQPTLAPQAPPPSAFAEVNGLGIALSISPGGPGVNTFDVQLNRSGLPMSDADVRVQLINPTLERRGQRHQAESVGDGLYAAAGAEVVQPGTWWGTVDVVSPNEVTRAAFSFDIRQEAALTLTRPPGVIHIAVLLAVLGVIGWVALPFGRRLMVTLDLRPITLLVSALAVLLGIGTVIGGIVLSEESVRQTEAALYPLPSIVNTQLPDAESLARGMILYETACSWSESPDLVRELAERLGRLRDEELFSFTQEGWRQLPACQNTLSESDRWDMVNYLRTLDLRSVGG